MFRDQPAGDGVKAIRSIAKYLSVFGAGALAAGFFLSGAVVDRTAHEPPTTTNSAWVLVPPTTPLERTDWTIAAPTPEPPQQSSPPITDRPNAETTGSLAAQAAEIADVGRIETTTQRSPACNVDLCRRFYRSFDEATCTYRPHGGGPPQLCSR